ncbi:hypothetical protein CEXT_539841 [Caerostris extrusa]|uniref:Uncharacterized protein n=1 Tax=Caerostris extrusa TaxID=172846 RepID=A0AAV4PZL5_CAEEX|nr:hypothetical protein CEXT_539841 [Caerostris extrusa]
MAADGWLAAIHRLAPGGRNICYGIGLDWLGDHRFSGPDARSLPQKTGAASFEISQRCRDCDTGRGCGTLNRAYSLLLLETTLRQIVGGVRILIRSPSELTTAENNFLQPWWCHEELPLQRKLTSESNPCLKDTPQNQTDQN